jgi:16S rRNA (cytosine1402-N4)-methyltransferase
VEVCHKPVLLAETIKYLAPRSNQELMIDATLGEGGHSFSFLSKFPDLSIVGIDADPMIQAVAKERLKEFGERIQFYSGWSHDFFADFPKDAKRPNTILIDLGISVYHYEKSERGFSFRKDEYLDMRLDPNQGISAAELIASTKESDLADLIYFNAEEKFSWRIAKAIVTARSYAKIETAKALAEIVEQAVPNFYRYGPIHPATKTFQALRIAVNGELERLEDLLKSALASLEIQGRLGVISFHSLEDRIVKNFFRNKNKDCICAISEPICKCGGQRKVNLLTKKAVSASAEEINDNPPSRSAKLRVIEKMLDEDDAA